ncbi:CPBP family intramembrane glutamic endopeptidase [Desertimonas flava]|uniref:CPBP family intramembrane glutamic endopeptidase n=1 Tax=Desertimonas flava TaxID=2064846 RepID=UPI0013C3F351|nr:type II CAAX endopeptidase family protein [Desertimonas flava]
MPLQPRRTALRSAGGRIDVPVAAAVWVCGWLVAQVAGVIVLSAAGYENVDEAAIWALFLAQCLGWSAMIGGLVFASRAAGTGSFAADYGVRVKPVDVLGVPIGVLTQLVVLPLVYLPLDHFWPATFNEDKLSETAKDLVDRAGGGSAVLLVLMVCVGAPIVEELVYRGMIQGSLAARIDPVAAWVIASAFFMLIHFKPVEYPGLLAAGLVFGACLLATGRIGPAIAAHVGFNVTGLILAYN